MFGFMSAVTFTAALSSAAYAHPNGTYEIDDKAEVTVTFKVMSRCPTDVEGALQGSLRKLTFSEAASTEPYNFLTGFYVEDHVNGEEIYRQTSESCILVEQGRDIPASHTTFGGYTLRKVSF